MVMQGEMGEIGTDGDGALPRGVERLMAFFASCPAAPMITEHRAVFTVAEAHEVERSLAGQNTKNLFLKDKKGGHFLLTAAADAVVDLKRLHGVLGARGRLSFASSERLAEYLGVAPGSVTPLALVNDPDRRVRFALDRTVAMAPLVNVHPLRNTATVSMPQGELAAFFAFCGHEPLVVDLSASDGI